MRSTTSSVRLPNDLRSRLDKATRQLKWQKNKIITQALEEFLERIERKQFLEDARKQSMLASAASSNDDDIWTELGDTDGWR